MAMTKPRKKRPAKAAAEAFGIAEILEMILLELAKDLQQNTKPRKKLEPANTLAKLRRVNSFFKDCIDGSTQLQTALQLSTYGKRDVLAPLDWLFKKQLGITISFRGLDEGSRRSKFKLREVDLNRNSMDRKPLRDFVQAKNKKSAMWRKIRIARPEDNLRKITIDTTFRLGGLSSGVLRLERTVYPKVFEFSADDTLGSVFELFRDNVLKAHREDRKSFKPPKNFLVMGSYNDWQAGEEDLRWLEDPKQ
ncbi:uncharacterized protein MYCFIDRAFT_78837 [Pseudocercospora fijiensis CIRAD86]|uniref:Uncharacterized protein n=1 Tax=Pseudocercospora fijiensis (strain CIRAD86) TaxID=383855 RepID=M3AAW4_PSEFD|nr:uncharacterized protein MYCFIDRAFT_78837 [Pseudocercospora fijiensis CIRAD86]EME81706.1 hypothetical protein MYCFIDRAFT_78837 [Pseudocercospora fijiensis CIRAD86]